VAKPATTVSLFESDDLPKDPAQRELCEHGLSAVSDARSIMLGEEDLETKKARLQEVLAVWQEELAGGPVPNKESAMDWKDITAESLKEHRKDLVDALTGRDELTKASLELKAAKEAVAAKDAALKEATDKLSAVEAEKAAQAKALAIAEELKAAKIDTSNKTLVSDAFMATLNAAPDAAARDVLIKDRVAVAGKIREEKHQGTPPFAPIGGDKGFDGPAKNKDEFMKRI
jgi:hypothetical protein